ncbi:hypothetical protein XBI1_2060021 [Xenorhabdus bovienii str. Intermedium]|uniref:Uncharacterized protein n=1 Tax=Xenorhabdus bovienii str. Intermedium TaxID=1379677 RepID=A0A077QH65_XENBV|nr:hypothetical protein XBI1_2060021 [Xenorhabdus bovienii str. Intermedium]
MSGYFHHIDILFIHGVTPALSSHSRKPATVPLSVSGDG